MANIQYIRILITKTIISIILLTNCVVHSSVAAAVTTKDNFWPSFIPREVKLLMSSCMSRTDAGYCLQKKFVEFLDRALMKDSIVLTEGLSIDKTKRTNITDFAPTARQQNGPFAEIVWNRLERFFNSRVLSVNLWQDGEEVEGSILTFKDTSPTATSTVGVLCITAVNSVVATGPSTFYVRGRKKKKKELAYYAVAVATAMALLIPLSLKGIAVIAGTALMIGKVALVLAGLSALKHFVHHQGDDSHRRVHIEDLTDGHNLAYSGYAATQRQHQVA